MKGKEQDKSKNQKWRGHCYRPYYNDLKGQIWTTENYELIYINWTTQISSTNFYFSSSNCNNYPKIK